MHSITSLVVALAALSSTAIAMPAATKYPVMLDNHVLDVVPPHPEHTLRIRGRAEQMFSANYQNFPSAKYASEMAAVATQGTSATSAAPSHAKYPVMLGGHVFDVVPAHATHSVGVQGRSDVAKDLVEMENSMRVKALDGLQRVTANPDASDVAATKAAQDLVEMENSMRDRIHKLQRVTAPSDVTEPAATKIALDFDSMKDSMRVRLQKLQRVTAPSEITEDAATSKIVSSMAAPSSMPTTPSMACPTIFTSHGHGANFRVDCNNAAETVTSTSYTSCAPGCDVTTVTMRNRFEMGAPCRPVGVPSGTATETVVACAPTQAA